MLRRLAERVVGFSGTRSLPAFRRDYFRDSEVEALAARGATNGEVMVFVDTFNRYFEPENVRAALRVIAASGRKVVPPPQSERPICCGRTYLSAGLVDRARVEARRTLAVLAGDVPVVGLEPSCLLTLRDEFNSLVPGPEAKALAGRAMLVGEWLRKQGIRLDLEPAPVTAYVHGHCHQKSFGAFDDTVASLGMIPDMKVAPISSSCCGMAGAFGYQAETQEVSRAMAEASLLPAVRKAGAGDLIVADGTSCRHQIGDLANRRATHSVRVLADRLRAPTMCG
jgi:Fe-S oxidoreductase